MFRGIQGIIGIICLKVKLVERIEEVYDRATRTTGSYDAPRVQHSDDDSKIAGSIATIDALRRELKEVDEDLDQQREELAKLLPQIQDEKVREVLRLRWIEDESADVISGLIHRSSQAVCGMLVRGEYQLEMIRRSE